MYPSSGANSVEDGVHYYKWNAPSGDLSIFLRLDLVDGLLSDAMSAFGALPRRGAEIGGVLLGRVDAGAITTIRIDGFERVPCSYRRGPSYLLCESDLEAFDASVRKHSGNAVGYFRSHTRDGESLGGEDRMLAARFFPAPHGIVLVIQPRVTRPATAGFLTYENGNLANWPATLFPFNSRELEDGRTAARPPKRDDNGAAPAAARGSARKFRPPQPPLSHEFSFSGYAEPSRETSRAAPVPAGRKIWPAAAIAIVCALLGMAGGIAARPFIPALNTPDHDPFVLSLSARRVDGKLIIDWDRGAPAVRYAQGGTLYIADGQFSKTVELTPNELQTGSVVFHNSSEHVTLRLEIAAHQASRISEVIEWEYAPPR